MKNSWLICGNLCKKATKRLLCSILFVVHAALTAGAQRLRVGDGMSGMAIPIMALEKNPDVQRMAYAKLLKHRNDVYGNRQYAKNPFFHVPDLNGKNLSLGGSIRHMEVLQMNGQDFVLADGHPLLTKAHVYQPLEK